MWEVAPVSGSQSKSASIWRGWEGVEEGLERIEALPANSVTVGAELEVLGGFGVFLGDFEGFLLRFSAL